MNLSFAGCGFLGIYHVGVAVCFKKYAPHLLLEKIGGASAGALAACCLLCDLPLGSMTSDFFRVVNEARRHSLGPFSPSFNIQTCLFEGLQKHLPEDAHKRVSGRLHISMTRVHDGQNVIISEFHSRDELLQALLCACFIPGFSGIMPPRFRGVRYMDGAFSDNLPILDENTITVSPFCGESDICPRDQSSQLFHLNWANTSIEISRQNINRFVRILFPPRPEFLSKFCQQGFDDALQFLHRNNLINCRRCVAVQSTFVVSETINQAQDFDPQCRECLKHRKDALSSNMPQTVLDVIQDYIEQANKGLANWLFKNRGIKLLSLPATVPIDFFMATVSKLTTMTPKLTDQLRRLLDDCLNQLNNAVQVKIFNKFSICDPPHFDASGLLHSNHVYGRPTVSILVDDCNMGEVNNDNKNNEENHLPLIENETENDYNSYKRVLNMTTHNDTLYAYYYTNNHQDNIKNVQDLIDISKNINTKRTELNRQRETTPDSLVNNWSNLQSDFFIDEQTAQSMDSLLNPVLASNLENLTNTGNDYGSSSLMEQNGESQHQQQHLLIDSSSKLGISCEQVTCVPLNKTTTHLDTNDPKFLANTTNDNLCIEIE